MPDGWSNIIDNRPEMFLVEQQATNLPIVFKKPVDLKMPSLTVNSMHSQSTKSLACDDNATMVDRNDTQANPMEPKNDGNELPAMKLPWNQPYWKIIITAATSSVDIWGRNLEADDWVSVQV